MADHDIFDDPFDALRDATRNAVLPEATAVRARGRQRQVRARAMYVATAAVVLAGGLTAGVALAGSGSDTAVVVPLTQTPTTEPTVEVTTEPSATPTQTPTATPPTTPPPPTPHATVYFAVTGVSGSNLTFSYGYDGLVPQLYGYDPATNGVQPIPLKYPQDHGADVIVDGINQGGLDAGDVSCDPHARLVTVHERSPSDATVALMRQGQPMTLSAGRHEAVLRMRFCEQGTSKVTSYQKRVTFTVS